MTIGFPGHRMFPATQQAIVDRLRDYAVPIPEPAINLRVCGFGYDKAGSKAIIAAHPENPIPQFARQICPVPCEVPAPPQVSLGLFLGDRDDSMLRLVGRDSLSFTDLIERHDRHSVAVLSEPGTLARTR